MILVWDENGQHIPREIHPFGIRGTVTEGLDKVGIDCRPCHLDEPDSGLSEGSLDKATAIIWWGHARHDEVPNDRIEAVCQRIKRGELGLVLLHSAHQSRIAEMLFGSRVYSKGGWDDDLQPERVRICAPEHPVCAGVHDFQIEDEEFYGAPGTFPPAEAVLAQSFFPRYNRYYPFGLAWTVGDGKGEIVRSGPGKGVGEGTGAGRIVYLRAGHETSRSLAHPSVRKLIANAVRWVSKPL